MKLLVRDSARRLRKFFPRIFAQQLRVRPTQQPLGLVIEIRKAPVTVERIEAVSDAGQNRVQPRYSPE